MEFEYECGNFESSNEKKVSFVRAANVSDVVKKYVTQLNESGFFVEKSNIPRNLLWVLLTGDKGGKSTKLLLQFLNCEEHNSTHTARLLAIYEGKKDNYQCLQKVFGPVIEETMKVLSNITELDLKVDLTEITRPSQRMTSEGWQIGLMSLESCSKIARMRIAAKGVCYVRKSQLFSNHIPPTVMPTSHPVQSTAFMSSGSVLGETGSSLQGYWV